MIEELESTNAKECLLPNEKVQFATRTRSGFLVLSSRRIVILKQRKQREYTIERAIPYDCIDGFETKKSDRLVVSGTGLDKYGDHTSETESLELRIPQIDSIMDQCMEVMERVRSSASNPPSPRDYSYLEKLPQSLTHNAMLDLNTILRDQPVHNELVYEAAKFLGDEPFLLEESLRDGDDRENGVLFAAGRQGYFWIQGVKSGRFMSNVVVDTVEWENVRYCVYQWRLDKSRFSVTYSKTKGGNNVTTPFLWNPPNNEDTSQYPWLLQQMNGPWIFADIVHRHSGKPLSASLHNQRYYH